MAQTAILKAAGLHTFPNPLSAIPEGSLLEANNVVIDKDGLIEPRRGLKLYGSSMSGSSTRAKQLMVYKTRILRHFGTSIEYDSDGQGAFITFNDSSNTPLVFSEPEAGIRLKSIEQNGNLYFTTSMGIRKISALTADDFAGNPVTDAGGIKALDVQVSLNPQEGFFGQESVVGYRVIWGIKDNNSNLILGSPSSRAVISNPLTPLLVNDFDRLLVSLDSDILTAPAGPPVGGYVASFKTASNASAATLLGKISALTTKLDVDLAYKVIVTSGNAVKFASVTNGLANVQLTSTISGASLSVGDTINIASFSGNWTLLNGSFTVKAIITTSVANDTIQFTAPVQTIAPNLSPTTDVSNASVTRLKYSGIAVPTMSLSPTTQQLLLMQAYYDSIITLLQADTSTLITGQPVGDFSTQSSTVNVTFSVPQNVTTNHFYQLYRTALTTSAGVNNLSLFDPGDEEGLVFEANPSASDLAAGSITIQDITPDSFRGANLYTNPNSGEGIAQANEIPPLAKDMASFKGSTFFANTQTKHRLAMSFLGVSDLSPLISSPSANVVSQVSVSANVCTLTFVNSANLSQFGIGNRVFLNTFKGSAQIANGEHTLSAVATHSISFPLVTSNFTDVTSADFGFIYRLSSLAVSDGLSTQNYAFYPTFSQISTITTTSGATIVAGHYFLLNGAKNIDKYYVWYKVSGAGTDPAIVGRSGIEVDVLVGDTNAQVATKTASALNAFADFTASASTNIVTLTLNQAGIASAPADGNSGYGFAVVQAGTGEDAINKRVLLSNLPTPSQQTDETARSLVRVVNLQASGLIYAFYLSGPTDVPGLMQFEARSIGQSYFFVVGDGALTGGVFNPDITPLLISTISTSSGGLVTVTSNAHGLSHGNRVIILGSDSTPSIDGIYLLQGSTTNTFTISDASVTVGGTMGLIGKVKSDNEISPNRIFYSKFSQPEAVPVVNFIDVGAKDRPIYRIVALRDSVFVLKSDAIYRITGENTANFLVSLFDNSAHILAPDTASVLNNQIVMFSTQGISTISDTGVQVISRPIENVLLPLSEFDSFYSASFSTSYEKDRAYLLFLPTIASDSVATQCLRYNTFTQTWTNWPLSKTCAVVNPDQDRLYVGAADTNFIEIERKTFTRLDYADRETSISIPNDAVSGLNLFLSISLLGVNVGDALTQTQSLTIGQLNQLLRKLDGDAGTSDKDYFSTLFAADGVQLRDVLTLLAAKLDADPRTYNSGSATRTYASSIVGYGLDFTSQQAAFNIIIGLLNTDAGISDFNYLPSTGTSTFEVRVSSVNNGIGLVTVDAELPFIVGPATMFARIASSVVWAPHFFQDPSLLKHVREGTMLFQNSSFSSALISYASDLMPSFDVIPFSGAGSGLFGEFSFGDIYFGGDGNGAPLRTYIPRDKQRCRFLNTKFVFANAFESYAIEGLSYTFEYISGRAYR